MARFIASSMARKLCIPSRRNIGCKPCSRPRARQCLRPRAILTMTVLFFVIFIYINTFSPGKYTGTMPWSSLPRCRNTQDEIDRMVKLTYKVHTILERMGIDSWLMYGSIWGPLRGIPGPLPWDYDVDLGINGSGKIRELTFEEFTAPFIAIGLSVRTKIIDSSYYGIYDGEWPNVDLMVFTDSGGVMKRNSMESWLFYLNYKMYHEFPSRLVEKPLPKVKFGFFNISVPRNGIEIMKYLYPHNWWKVVKPKSCV